MGGKSSQTNSTDQAMGLIDSQIAGAREADRASRIKQGLARVDGAFGGFDDNYFRNYATAQNEYNMPQLDQQYGDAQKELTYRHARAGTLNSSSSANNVADLAKQYATNAASVRAMGDQAAANLRSRVAAERSGLQQQLYATEDPDLASNSALTAYKSLGADQPSMSPLGQMFSLATVGAGNFMQGYNTGTAYKNAFGSINGGGSSANNSRIVG